MPATPLARFLREVIGPCTVVDWHRSSGAKRVLEVEDVAGTRWFGKRIHAEQLWRGELDGYAWWGSLAATPRLHARRDDLRAMVLTALPGPTARGDDPATFEAAGALLRRLHAARTPVRDDAWLHRTRRTAALDRARTDQVGRSVDPRLVARCLEGVEQLSRLDELPVVPTHGDFLPRNWILRPTGLGVIDFTEAALRPAVHDFARLRLGPCWDDASLWSALLSGYGRELTEAEERLLGHELLLGAVLAVGWGTARGLPHVRDRGLEVLARASRRAGSVTPPGRPSRRRIPVARVPRTPRAPRIPLTPLVPARRSHTRLMSATLS